MYLYGTLLVCFFTPLWIFLSMVVFRRTQNIYVLLTRTCPALMISFAYHSFNKCILSVYKNVISDYYILLKVILYIIVHSNKLLYCACHMKRTNCYILYTMYKGTKLFLYYLYYINGYLYLYIYII